MSLIEYLSLLDWAGRQQREDKRGAIPEELPPILERLNLDTDRLGMAIRDFRKVFGVAMGRADNLARFSAKVGHRWMQRARASSALLPGR